MLQLVLVDDAVRGKGEARSVREMVAWVRAQYGTDPKRVFVTGLSAGGAMAAVMLATYPDTFAGGAIIAGLPLRVARSKPEAFDRMRGHGLPRPEVLVELVRPDVIEEYSITGLRHGTPLDTRDHRYHERAAPFMLRPAFPRHA